MNTLLFYTSQSEWTFFIIMSQHAKEKSVLFVSYPRLAGWLGWRSGWQILQNSPSACLQVCTYSVSQVKTEWETVTWILWTKVETRQQTFFFSAHMMNFVIGCFLAFVLQLLLYENVIYFHLLLILLCRYFCACGDTKPS